VLVLLFLFVVIQKKKRDRIFACGGTVHLRQRYYSKQIFLVELGIGLLFPEGKQCYEQD
jgi:hypothetical protein